MFALRKSRLRYFSHSDFDRIYQNQRKSRRIDGIQRILNEKENEYEFDVEC